MNNISLDQNLQNFFLNSNVQLDFSNFILAIILSLILAYIVKFTYIKVGRALNDKDYFSDTFIPLAIITTLVITVVKFSLALSLGLVGALSIVRFRAAIKEPEELVYLFFVIAIGLANGANQFLLSIFATTLISTFLFIRSFYFRKKNKDVYFSADSNILNISILNNEKFKIDNLVNDIKKNFKYLKLKYANIEEKVSNYIFWFEIDEKSSTDLLKNLSSLSSKDLTISVYSKSGAFE